MSAANAGAIEAAIEAVAKKMIDEIHTMLPAKIIKQNPDGTIDAEPSIATIDDDGAPLRLPIIYSIPLMAIGVGRLVVDAPVNPGDDVILIFSERAIDGWITGRQQAAETDGRRHSLIDAIALPWGNSNTPTKTAKIIDTETGSNVEFKKNGTISINNGALEVLK